MTPESQLNLRSQHPDFQYFLDINENESVRVRNDLCCFLDEKYGEAPLQTLDIFPSNFPNSPIVIFIHGGYWRALDKRSYSFVAEPFVKNNLTTCIVNYRLIPTVNMQGVITDIATCIKWIQQKADRFNGAPNKIMIYGHSAGGQLALISYLLNKHLRSDIKAIGCLSGIYDLAPIKNSYLNQILQLTESDVERYSITNKDISVLQCPVLLGVGSDETNFFVEQSKNLYQEKKADAPITYYEFPELNHYQIAHELGNENSSLVEFALQNIE